MFTTTVQIKGPGMLIIEALNENALVTCTSALLAPPISERRDKSST